MDFYGRIRFMTLVVQAGSGRRGRDVWLTALPSHSPPIMLWESMGPSDWGGARKRIDCSHHHTLPHCVVPFVYTSACWCLPWPVLTSRFMLKSYTKRSSVGKQRRQRYVRGGWTWQKRKCAKRLLDTLTAIDGKVSLQCICTLKVPMEL